MNNFFVHESSYVDENVKIGEGTKIWHFCHIQKGAVIGEKCSLGQNVNISNNVKIGNGCKLQNNVSLYEGVELDTLEPEAFFTEALDMTKRYFDDKTVIVGHTPTVDGKIQYGNGSINIDCGEARDGRVGCLRLEDMKEFYI
jgi:NDP-sugar pyrophosphorylase family protein